MILGPMNEAKLLTAISRDIAVLVYEENKKERMMIAEQMLEAIKQYTSQAKIIHNAVREVVESGVDIKETLKKISDMMCKGVEIVEIEGKEDNEFDIDLPGFDLKV